jgi:hypothetical protein
LNGGKWQVSATGGVEPAWSRDGRELFYIDASEALVSVPVQTTPTFSAGNATKLFDAPYFAVSGTRRYDVSPDGQRFLFIKNTIDASGAVASPSLVVVEHFEQVVDRAVSIP